MNLNKVFLIGNLTRDPELRTLPSGAAVASFGIATNRVWKNQQGGQQKDTQFHNIVVFGRQAEIASQYLAKGSMAHIEGRLQTRSWDGKDGSKQSRTEIVAERIQFGPRTGLGSGTRGARPFGTEPREGVDTPPQDDLPEIDLGDDVKAEDLPF
ncbi:single-stranded DNA-binding protein [Candidatus Wolfebacteria bacterium]|nr:single-stranded DNA-binding protein [Candidatus Wolfebacteria bacterium]